MKKKLLALFCIASGMVVAPGLYAQTASDSTNVKESRASKKEEKNRNVMLNANDNIGPRNVNIGLPFTGTMHFGRLSVIGLSLFPSPAARTIVHKEEVLETGCVRLMASLSRNARLHRVCHEPSFRFSDEGTRP